MLYSPNEVTAVVGKEASKITVREITGYPFEDSIRLQISADKNVAFPLSLRIPAWCLEATVIFNGSPIKTGKGGSMITLDRTWKNGDKLTLILPMHVTTSNWGRNSRAIERGPLVYALKLDEKWEKGHQEVEGDYFSVYPKNDWNYGLPDSIIAAVASATKVNIVKPVDNDFIWNLDHAPIEITTIGKKIPAWKVNADGVASQPVSDRTGIYKGTVDTDAKTITLVPYGCTKVRIVAFPVVE
jgi:hypothetical protein